jgi:hypothetical protein
VDPGNHGWLVVVAAVLGFSAFVEYGRRPRLRTAAIAFFAGAAGTALTLYDRHQLDHGFTGVHVTIVELFQLLVHIDWGLDIATAASILVGLGGLSLVLIEWGVSRREALQPRPGKSGSR